MGDEARFAVVPYMAIEKMDADEIGLYCTLALHADKWGWCWPSQKRIALLCNRSQGWVSKRLDSLVDKMIVEKVGRRGGNTLYRLPIGVRLNHPEYSEGNIGYQDSDPVYSGGNMEYSPGNKNNTINNTIEHIPPIVPQGGRTVKFAEGWTKEGFNDDFEDIWQSYPRKDGKAPAKRALEKVARKVPFEAFASALHAQLKRWKDEGREKQYIPHFSTWLNEERWEDFL